MCTSERREFTVALSPPCQMFFDNITSGYMYELSENDTVRIGRALQSSKLCSITWRRGVSLFWCGYGRRRARKYFEIQKLSKLVQLGGFLKIFQSKRLTLAKNSCIHQPNPEKMKYFDENFRLQEISRSVETPWQYCRLWCVLRMHNSQCPDEKLKKGVRKERIVLIY